MSKRQMSTWVVPIVVCFLVGVFSFFIGRWSCRSNTKVGIPSTSTNNAKDEICPACRGIGHFSSPGTPDQDTEYCKKCGGQGKLSPIAQNRCSQ